MNPIKIDLEGGKGYVGLGDLVMLAWLAEGCRLAGQSITFHRTRNPELMSLFGLTVDPEPGGVRTLGGRRMLVFRSNWVHRVPLCRTVSRAL